MKSDISNMLSRFFKKYKHQLDSEDVDKFGNLWKNFYDTVVEDDVWKKGSKHFKNFLIHPGQIILVKNII